MHARMARDRAQTGRAQRLRILRQAGGARESASYRPRVTIRIAREFGTIH